MKKQLKKPIPLIHPAPICIIGTIVNNKANFTTIGDIAVAGLNPPLVMISINENHGSMNYLKKKIPFSINMTIDTMIKEVDFAGMFSSKTTDKSTLFNYNLIDNVPVLNDSPVSLLVKETERVQIEQRVIIICNVLKTFVHESLLNQNVLCLEELPTIVYGLDNKYYTIGKKIGIGYREGVKD